MTTRKKKSSMQDYLAKNAEAFVSSEAVDGSESPIQLPKPKKILRKRRRVHLQDLVWIFLMNVILMRVSN